MHCPLLTVTEWDVLWSVVETYVPRSPSVGALLGMSLERCNSQYSSDASDGCSIVARGRILVQAELGVLNVVSIELTHSTV